MTFFDSLGDHHHPAKTTDTIIHGCQVKNIIHSAIIIDNSLLSRLTIDGIKRFIVEAKLIRTKYEIGGIMENVKWEVKDNKLIIEVDLSLESGPSKSGKTITIASTKGNQKIEGTNAVIGLNVYKYPEES